MSKTDFWRPKIFLVPEKLNLVPDKIKSHEHWLSIALIRSFTNVCADFSDRATGLIIFGFFSAFGNFFSSFIGHFRTPKGSYWTFCLLTLFFCTFSCTFGAIDLAIGEQALSIKY